MILIVDNININYHNPSPFFFFFFFFKFIKCLQGLIPHDFFALFFKIAKPSLSQQVSIALALTQSTDQKVQDESAHFVKSKLSDLADTANVDKLSEQTLYELVYFLRTSSLFSQSERTSYLDGLAKVYPNSFNEGIVSTLLFNPHEGERNRFLKNIFFF